MLHRVATICNLFSLHCVAMSRDLTPFGLRMPPSLKGEVTAAAQVAGRSMNAEIISRLQSSFCAPDYIALPFPVVQAVAAAMEDGGLTQEVALTQLVLAGQSKGGTVLHLHIAPGTTAKDVHTALTAALKLIPPDSNVISAQG